MSEFDSVFAQAIEPGMEFDDSVFAQQDSDAIDIINHTGKFSNKKIKDFETSDYDGLGDDIGPGHDTKFDAPRMDTARRKSAYSNDTDISTDDKFDEAAQNLLEELISGDDDGSDELDLFGPSDDTDDLSDYHDPSDTDFELDDDDDVYNATVNDTPATRGIDAPIATHPDDIAINDTHYSESAMLDENKYSKFLEWAIASGVQLNDSILEAARREFVLEDDKEDIKASDIKPTKQDKELVDDEITDDTEDEEDIEEVEDKAPDKGKVSDAVINDLNSDEDEDILNDLSKD